MPAQTPIYGFPFEVPSDQPGISLTGGSSGLSPILAEEVEDELARVDTDLSDALARLALLEAGTSMVGWVPIQSGNNTGANFDIDLTDGGRFSVGEFALLRLHMRYDLDDPGAVYMRINNDATAVYNWGMRTLDAANPSGDLTSFPITQAGLGVDVITHDNTTFWRVGWGATISTNNLVCTIFHTDGNFLHGFQSTSTRMSTSATTHAQATAWGNLTGGLSATPSSLRMFVGAGALSYSDAWWWAEGYRVPA